jgi:hypothetical protein
MYLLIETIMAVEVNGIFHIALLVNILEVIILFLGFWGIG